VLANKATKSQTSSEAFGRPMLGFLQNDCSVDTAEEQYRTQQKKKNLERVRSEAPPMPKPLHFFLLLRPLPKPLLTT
jgi:hypothetical protein